MTRRPPCPSAPCQTGLRRYPAGIPGGGAGFSCSCRVDRGRPRAEHGPHREVEARRARRQVPLARRVRRTPFDAAVHHHAPRRGRVRDRRHAEPTRRQGERSLHARRHHAVQHGCQPEEREGLRLEHRGAQRRALRGAHAGLHVRRGQHRRQPHLGHRPRERLRHRRQPEPAPHARRAAGDRRLRRSHADPRVPAGPHVLRRRKDGVRRRRGLLEARRLRHGLARVGGRDAHAAEPGQPDGRRPDGRRHRRRGQGDRVPSSPASTTASPSSI